MLVEQSHGARASLDLLQRLVYRALVSHVFVVWQGKLDQVLPLRLGQDGRNRSAIAIVHDFHVFISFIVGCVRVEDRRLLVYLGDLLVNLALDHLLQLVFEQVARVLPTVAASGGLRFEIRGSGGVLGQVFVRIALDADVGDFAQTRRLPRLLRAL